MSGDTANTFRGTANGTVIQARTIGGVHLHVPGRPHLPPRQLPPPRLLVNRSGELHLLDAGWRTRTGPLWVGVEGPPGIGKTALATGWGHSRARWWPDGALYADLAAADADTVLAGWLRALGVDHIPHGPQEVRGLWRTVTSVRRLLVVVDNTVPDVAVDLLPAGPDCAGIATSHTGMTDLVASGGRVLPLAPLPADETRHLIARLTPEEPDQAVLDAAVNSSRGHPLTAVLTAAYLARHPSASVAQLTTRKETTVVDDRVTGILTSLPAHVERAARLLAVHPGPHLPLGLAASILATSPADARRLLHELVDAELVTDLGGGRWTHHQLTAAALDNALDPELRGVVVDTIGQYYRVRAAAAGQVLNPHRWRIDTNGVGLAAELQQHDDDGPWFSDRDAALAWVDAELDNLRAAVQLCSRTGRPHTTWQLIEHLGTYLTLRKPRAATEELYPAALAAAEAAEHPVAQAWAHQRLAATARDWEQALEHAETALGLYQRAEHAMGVASAHESLAAAHLQGGDLDQASNLFERAVQLHLRLDPPRHRGAAMQSRKKAEVDIWRDRPAEALAALRRARELLINLEDPDRYQAARCRAAEVTAHRALGDLDQAERVAHTALSEAREVGAVHVEARLHEALADIAQARGDHGQEVIQLTHAARLLEPTGHPDMARVRARLAEL